MTKMKNRLFDLLMPVVPKNHLSHWVGRLVHQPLPDPLANASVAAFAKYYQINMSEAEYPLTHYRTIGDLFTRSLKPEARPLGQGAIVHPADARISEAGRIEKLTLVQAKGKTYTVPELLRSSHYAQGFEGGTYLTYYLCPTDYHRVHSPVDGEIVWSCHVPGEFWPVNEWSVNAVPNLFAVNERVVVLIETVHGRAALVMVAATNVGNMTMRFDHMINTGNRGTERRMRERSYNPKIPIKRGAEVGVFNMGSTVIMLYEKGMVSADPAGFRGRISRVNSSLA